MSPGAAGEVRASLVVSCFRAESHLARFLESVSRQTALDRMELVLVHNEPTAKELELVSGFERSHPGRLRHVIVETVEPWGTSMNRGIRASSGEYVCIGNVDDVRADDSVEREMRALDEHPAALVTYGDYVRIGAVGATDGRLEVMPEFDQESFVRYYSCGPFPMWRRAAHATVGVFDEQLRSGADFDLMARMALAGPMVHVGGSLGFYLDVGEGLSTRGDLSYVERTVIAMRYGDFDIIDTRYLPRARRYAVRRLMQEGVWHDVAEFVPGYAERMRQRRPLWIRCHLRNAARVFPRLAKVVFAVKRRLGR